MLVKIQTSWDFADKYIFLIVNDTVSRPPVWVLTHTSISESMHISKVSLVNYRNFKNENFHFNKHINTIIGENGSGKTNVFRAIRLLLEDSSLQFAYKLDEPDFNRSLGDWRGHWIIISIEFDDISKDEAIQSLFIHGTGVLQEAEYVEQASYTLFFRPKAEIRLRLSELVEGDTTGLEEIIESISIKRDYETFFVGKSTVDFTDEEVYRHLVGDFENVRFNFDIDTSLYGVKIPHQLSVAKEVSFTFVKALRDVVSDFRNNRTNPLLSLLKSKAGEIDDADYDPIIGLVGQLNDSIESLPDVREIKNGIEETIRDTVGETYSPSSISIKSSLSAESTKLLQSLKLFVGEPGETHEGGISELSLGGANLIFLTLKLLEYKYQKGTETFANFLIIEEPEAHIHTHIQKTLFDNLDHADTQIIYSTHSTHISDVSNVSNINILAKKENHAEVYQPSTGLDDKSINQIQRYLDAIRSNLLFAKGVMLVEGDAEELLIPPLVKAVLGISLDELGISLINIRSTGFENVAQLFHDDRIRRKCSILTDLDEAICNTDIVQGDSERIKKYKNKVRRSKEKGLERKVALDEFTDGNVWLETFYADHTFEVDFVKCGNAYEVIELLDDVYTDEKIKKKADTELDSEDVSLYGKRVLTMAEQEGKGWFAIMLGKHIFYRTYIPEYILQAITFAKGSFSTSLIGNIIRYRVTQFKSEEEVLDFTSLMTILAEFENGNVDLDAVIGELRAIKPNDPALNFLTLL